jgi:cullin-4
MSATNLGRQRHSAGAPAPAKKLVIRPLKAAPVLPEGFEAASWAALRGAVHAVQARQPVAAGLEALYRAVEDMCLHKLAPRLYALLQAELDAHAARRP